MKKFLVLALILFTGCLQEDFCGYSSYSECNSSEDCVIGGCSSQVCQAKTEEPTFTTCEYRECYNDKAYNLECKCAENKCEWGKI